jgi:hypothetical protein
MFDAARDLVFTNSADGNSITSGGYRINKIFGGMKRKQKGGKNKKEHEDYNEEMENFYKEESGIPMGLLFVVPKFRVEHLDHASKKESDFQMNNNDRIAGIGDIELIIPNPQSQASQASSQFVIIGDDNNCGLREDAREINSQEVDADLFGILLENALTDHNYGNQNAVSRRNTRKRTINFENNSNNNNSINLKNMKMDKVYTRRKTRRNNK